MQSFPLAAIVLGFSLPALPVAALINDATDIQVGERHACIIGGPGSDIKCWGNNYNAELGLELYDNTRGDSPEGMGINLPWVNLGTGLKAKTFVAGGAHNCAILNNGKLKCWGGNIYGQLGLGSSYNSGRGANSMGDHLAYVSIGSDVTVTDVSAGDAHTCAVLTTQKVKCWGANDYGQLGLSVGDYTVGTLPGFGSRMKEVDLGKNVLVAKVFAGFLRTCAITTTGQVKCWGANSRYSSDNGRWFPCGQLGIGSTKNYIGRVDGEMGDKLPFVNLGTGATAVNIVHGWYHTCALLSGGSLVCWGDNSLGELGRTDSFGQIGTLASEMGDNLVPVNLGTNFTIASLGAGLDFTCALSTTNVLKCWGGNANGELGQGSANGQIPVSAPDMGDHLPAIDFGDGLTPLKFSAGGSSVCTLLNNNKVKCWGNNDYGQLGICSTDGIGTGSADMGNSLAFVDDCGPTEITKEPPSKIAPGVFYFLVIGVPFIGIGACVAFVLLYRAARRYK